MSEETTGKTRKKRKVQASEEPEEMGKAQASEEPEEMGKAQASEEPEQKGEAQAFEEPEENGEAQASEEPEEKQDGPLRRILLVDDDAEIIEALRVALSAKGYEVLIARDGNQGLAMAERDDPDLVILDMMMPKRSGFLVLERLRRTRPVPMRVIMITANEGSRHKAYAEMLGVDDYIRKPFPMDRLMESVTRLLS